MLLPCSAVEELCPGLELAVRNREFEEQEIAGQEAPRGLQVRVTGGLPREP